MTIRVFKLIFTFMFFCCRLWLSDISAKPITPLSTNSVNDTVPVSDSLNPFVGKDTLLSEDISELNSYLKDFDHISTWEGKSYIVRITNNKDDYIFFKYPLNQNIEKIPISHISKIDYASGKTETFKKVDENQTYDLTWEMIKIVEDISQLKGMEEMEEVYAKFESKKIKVKDDYLIKYGQQIIQRKAVQCFARAVLITDKKIYKAYGDLPYIEIWGIMYK